MLLVLDIGNTNVKIGIFKGNKLISTWRVSTQASHTADEYGMMVYDLLRSSGASFKDIEGSIMSSVSPAMNYTIEHMCQYYTNKKPVVVNANINTGIEIKYDHPSELGADRIVDCVAAYKLYGGPAIVVDFGSATTFNLVTKDGVFIGGAIAPGVKTAADSLVNVAAKLPRVELSVPENPVGTNTISGMQSGIVYGYTGLVKYIVEMYKRLPEMKDAKVIATGGLSELVTNADKTIIDIIDRKLALEGLKIIYDLNKKEK